MPYFILVICLCMVVAMFALQNPVVVTLNFGLWSFDASLVIVILGAFLCGLLVATLFMLTMKAKHYMHDMKLQNEMQRQQKEIKTLKEQITMLQHAQRLHNQPEKNETVERAGKQ